MQTGSYVSGKWYHPKSSRLVRNANPADPDDVLSEFPAATAADVGRAIDAAQAAFVDWRKTPGPERGRVLWRAADIARQRGDEIAHTLTREEGKVLKEFTVKKQPGATGMHLTGFSLNEGEKVQIQMLLGDKATSSPTFIP